MIKQTLAAGYSYEANRVCEAEWCELLQQFEDANIYQTWSHAAVVSGQKHLSHIVVRKNADVVAIVQARIAKVPGLPVGIAYIRWGPLWKRAGQPAEVEHFRQALRAIRQEFVVKQHLVLRIFPIVIDDPDASFSRILGEEGFRAKQGESRARTILMNLAPSLDELREGMKAHWKRELKAGEKAAPEIVEGTDDSLFADFIVMYKEMVSRKKFVEPNDIHQFREIQSRLPEKLKMKVMLAKSNGEVCAGLICSALGDTAVYLFGATSNAGMKSRGSYLLHWKLLDQLKQAGIRTYNLNGINPEKNPGTYKFKDDLAGTNGQDVFYAGRFDTHAGGLSRWAVDFADGARAKAGKVKSWRRELSKRKEPAKLQHQVEVDGASKIDAASKTAGNKEADNKQAVNKSDSRPRKPNQARPDPSLAAKLPAKKDRLPGNAASRNQFSQPNQFSPNQLPQKQLSQIKNAPGHSRQRTPEPTAEASSKL